MKTKLTTISLLFIAGISALTGQTLSWVKSAGGTSYEQAYSVVTDKNGNVFTTGSFEGTVDFDPSTGVSNLTSSAFEDIFIQKLDVNGNFLWAKKMGSTNYDYGVSIALDSAGNIYSTGYFGGAVDFDPGNGTSILTASGNNDVFIQKLDTNGDFVWAKKVGGTDLEIGKSITLDKFGNVLVCGYFRGTVDFDPGLGTTSYTSSGYDDIFILKLNTNGDFVWAKKIGGVNFDSGFAIKTDNSGNIYATGDFEGIVDFDPSGAATNLVSMSGSKDIFILKLDSNGNFLWAKKVGGTDNDTGYGIAIDNLGNIYTTGYFRSTVDFDPGAGVFNLTAPGVLDDTFIQKLDNNGNFVWVKNIQGSGANFATAIAIDLLNNVYITGDYSGTVDFDPGPNITYLTAIGNKDVFIQKLDVNGNFVWVKTMGGTASYAQGKGINVDAFQNIYVAGYYSTTVDFDPGTATINATAIGGQDIFVLKLNQNTSTAVSENTMGAITLYPNPTTGYFAINFDKIQDVTITIKNIVGQTISSASYNAISQTSLKIEAESGLYFVEIQNQTTGKVSVLKVQKN